jgi:hypothetical protein
LAVFQKHPPTRAKLSASLSQWVHHSSFIHQSVEGAYLLLGIHCWRNKTKAGKILILMHVKPRNSPNLCIRALQRNNQ